MNEDDLETLRLRLRVMLLEGLAIRTALLAPVFGRHLSMQESLAHLEEALDASSGILDQTYGGHFQEPGLAALYAEEAKEIIEKWKRMAGRAAAKMT